MKVFKLEHRGVSGSLHAFNDKAVNKTSLTSRYEHLEISYHGPMGKWFYEMTRRKIGQCERLMRRSSGFKSLSELIEELRLAYPAYKFHITPEQIKHSTDYYVKDFLDY